MALEEALGIALMFMLSLLTHPILWFVVGGGMMLFFLHAIVASAAQAGAEKALSGIGYEVAQAVREAMEEAKWDSEEWDDEEWDDEEWDDHVEA
jgi:hypothetical protein